MLRVFAFDHKQHPFTVKETDRLSVVTYDAYIYVNFDLMLMNKANKKEAKALVDSIRSGTQTNLCGGLLKGTLATIALPIFVALQEWGSFTMDIDCPI